MNLKGLKLVGIMGCLFIMATGGLCIKYQQERLVNLRQNNVRLGQQLKILQARIAEARTRAASLSAALTTRQQTQQRLEGTYEQYEKQLRRAVAQAPCASQPVPDDIIRMQHNAFSDVIAPD